MHPAVIFLIIVSAIIIIIFNPKYAIIIITFLSILIPMGQRVEIYSLNFYIFRFLILIGWIKILINKELKLGEMVRTDKAIIYWVIVSFIIYIIQQNNINAVKYQLGFSYNAIGTYFLYRIILKNNADIIILLKTLVIVAFVVAVCMISEQFTGKNLLYSVFGMYEPLTLRMGHIRSQGPFTHSIYAGMFGATIFPLCFSMWRNRWGSYFFGIIGTISACVIVITTTSMTPIVALISGLLAILFWPLKKRMSIVRYCILFFAIVIQIIIGSPLWAVIKKLDFIKGASTLHRFELLNNLIYRFDEWFLIGSASYGDWGYGMADRANQYYLEAVNGGLLRLTSFILIIVFSFIMIGRKIKILKDERNQKMLWALGSALFSTVVGFIGISYFDQMVFIYFMLLSLITSACVKIDDSKINMVKIYDNKINFKI